MVTTKKYIIMGHISGYVGFEGNLNIGYRTTIVRVIGPVV
jgi:hypothetical protein